MIRLQIEKSDANKTSFITKILDCIRIKKVLKLSFKESWLLINYLRSGKRIIFQPIHFNSSPVEDEFIEWLIWLFLCDFDSITTKISSHTGLDCIVDSNKYNYFTLKKVIFGVFTGVNIQRYENVNYSIYIEK